MHTVLWHRSKMRVLRLLETLRYLRIHELLTQGSLWIIDKWRDLWLLKGDEILAKEILAWWVIHLPGMYKLVKQWYNQCNTRSYAYITRSMPTKN
jgi:hypothetical protein